MAQHTSVEWLVEEFRDTILKEYGELRFLEIIEQAKEMHKAEMHECASFWRGKENDIEKPIFEEYYNETFNK